MKHSIFFASTFLALVTAAEAYSPVGPIERFTALSGHQDSEVAPRLSYFDQILNWADQSEDVQIAETHGAWTGRCFDRMSKSTPLNSLLITQSEDDQLGPGFQSNVFMSNLSAHGMGASFFDDYDIFNDSSNARMALANLVAKKMLSPAIYEDEGPLTWTFDFEPNGRSDLHYELTQHGDYMVLIGSNLIDGNIIYSSSRQTTFRNVAVGPWTACYYFKKL